MLLLRLMARSGGAIAVSLALVGLAFYGIGGLSVMMVDDPVRGLQVLIVFILLSGLFLVFLRWAALQVVRQVLRPLGAAKDTTSRWASLGGRGGEEAFRAVGDGLRAAGWFASRAAAGALSIAASLFQRRGRPARPPARPAPVIPIRRGQDRKAR
ncbi:MAG: hypothetical protein HYZ11_04435 [Candidatus Tectomicrobia bacterium]|uniref:Uncharacterized protein n=1 Tax=Tectimicrobiota bacterium TaxID=2528274 RepID=A0A932ML63_UNCTE|nr:hypothetical protein [Candidatus Tectomicrobia bacterium]